MDLVTEPPTTMAWPFMSKWTTCSAAAAGMRLVETPRTHAAAAAAGGRPIQCLPLLHGQQRW